MSANVCSQTYPGRSADSEPETRALQTLFRQLFADQRGPGDGAAAPATTRGAMITLHSYAGMNLFPWGWTNTHSANEAALRRIAARMSQLNGYLYGQPVEILYNASGTSDERASNAAGATPTVPCIGSSGRTTL